MLSFGKPSTEAVRRFVSEQANHSFSYAAVGEIAGIHPAGYTVDHTRMQLGEGKELFTAAKAAIRRWDQFHFSWLEAGPAETPIQVGEVVAVMAHSLDLWWLNACRIVSVIDEMGPVSRFGFSYGTLPDHAASGEERFLVEWHEADNSVWYDILAFSRPRHFLARLGYPMFRRIQKKFAHDSVAAMKNAAAATDANGNSARTT
jgi:uncharacterized protein (UPF0548 family)